MATSPIDYNALAKQAGAISSTPAPAGGGVDYAALAKQAGAISSTPAPAAEPGFLTRALAHTMLALKGQTSFVGDTAAKTSQAMNPENTLRAINELGSGDADRALHAFPNPASHLVDSARSLQAGDYAGAAEGYASGLLPGADIALDTFHKLRARDYSGAAANVLPFAFGAAEAEPAMTSLANKAGDALSSAGDALHASRDTLAGSVRASAEKNIATAINPTTKVNKALVRDKLAPGILDRGIVATSLHDLQEKAQAGMQEHGQTIDDLYDQHAEAGTAISPKPILAALEAEKQAYTVDGVVVNPAYVSGLDGMQKQLQAISDANGGAIPLASLRRVRQIHDEIVAQSKNGFALPADAQSAVNASKTYSNAIRSTFADAVPELADANREFSFHANLDKVVGDSLLRKTGQRAPLTQKLLENAGIAAGSHIAGPAGAIVGKSIGGNLGKLQNSTIWNTLSAQAKNKIADLLATGDTAAAEEFAGNPENLQSKEVHAQTSATPTSESASVPGTPGTSAGTGAPTGRGGAGARTVLEIPGKPGGGYQAEYKLKELDEINASHNGLTFSPNAEYGLTNDRNYQSAVNQGKIVAGASPVEFKPSLHITDNPDATNGPMVLDSAGNVIGGNGRTMMLQRVYQSNPKGAAAYRALLTQKAAQFGIDPAQIAGMKKPVLVREIPDSELLGPNARQNAVTDLNKVGTAPLTPSERAIADSVRVSPSTLADVAGRLEAHGPESSLADALAGKAGGEVLEKLIQDGVVAPQERSAFVQDKGELTPAGKDRISALIVGRFFRDPKQLDTIQPSIRARVERITAPLAQVESKGDWSLTSQMQDALELLERARSSNLDDFIKTDGLFGAQKYSPEVITLAKALKSGKSQDLTAAARAYAADASFASKGVSMFGDAPTPESSFAATFGSPPAPAPVAAANALADGSKTPAGSKNALAIKAGEAAIEARRPKQRGSLDLGGKDPYREQVLDLGWKIRNSEPVTDKDFEFLKPEDLAQMRNLQKDYRPLRAAAPVEPLAVAKRGASGFELVTGKFDSLRDDDAFLYHVTTKANAAKILSHGLTPGLAPAMADGFYRDYSRGKVFLSDASGVSYWQEKIANHMEHQTGRAPNLVVLRIPKTLAGELSPDTLGGRDSGRGSYFATQPIGAAPQNALAKKPQK